MDKKCNQTYLQEFLSAGGRRQKEKDGNFVSNENLFLPCISRLFFKIFLI
jgi:hypothetical protein